MDHSDEAETDVAFTRIFDDGSRMILPGEEGDDADAGLIALDTASCTGTECHCHEVDMLAQPLALVGGKVVDSGDPLHATLDVESGEISVEKVPDPGTSHALLLERLRRQLRGDRLEAMHERWRRARRQDDPDEWKETDWSGVDLEAMVPFFELFPSRWDLSVVLDGRRYWIVDLWCLTPDCPCTEVALDFVASDDESTAHLFVDLETGQPNDPDATETAHRLWNALTENADALGELRTRHEAARRVARELPEHLAPSKPVVAGPRAGRNDPCPCGSGKKFKRCCGP